MAEIYILKCLSQSEANCSKSKIQAQRLLRFGFGGVGAFLSVSTIAKTYNFMTVKKLQIQLKILVQFRSKLSDALERLQ